jgi:hypothetical protein
MRDIIVVWGGMDSSYITLNGVQVSSGIERGYEVGETLTELFNKLDYSKGKPLVKDIYDEDWFSTDEDIAFWDRNNDYYKNGEDKFFTDDELQVLQEIEDIEKFIEKIKENIKSYIKEEE